MEFEPEVAVELVAQVFQEVAVGVEPRHLVFVLVGHELEQVARHRRCQLGRAAEARACAARSISATNSR